MEVLGLRREGRNSMYYQGTERKEGNTEREREEDRSRKSVLRTSHDLPAMALVATYVL